MWKMEEKDKNLQKIGKLAQKGIIYPLMDPNFEFYLGNHNKHMHWDTRDYFQAKYNTMQR